MSARVNITGKCLLNFSHQNTSQQSFYSSDNTPHHCLTQQRTNAFQTIRALQRANALTRNMINKKEKLTSWTDPDPVHDVNFSFFFYISIFLLKHLNYWTCQRTDRFFHYSLSLFLQRSYKYNKRCSKETRSKHTESR